jgi:3-oxoacyl-[acyl-carrier-protein] synthase-3
MTESKIETPTKPLPFISSRISGTGSAFPKRVMTNAEFCDWISGFKNEHIPGFGPEWILDRTGIEKRHLAGPHETVSDLGTAAAERALESAGLDAVSIDGIILATCTPDQPIPAAATLIQKKLRAKNAFAFDLNAACSGFHHAWAMGHALILAGQAKNLLIIGAEVLSAITDYSDPRSAILFGDGAGAMVLSLVENHPRSKFVLTADGHHGDLFQVPAGGSARPIYGVEPGSPPALRYSETRMQMKGPEIFKASVRAMVDLSDRLLASLGKTAADIDFVVPHQANLRILERVAKRQNLGMDRFILNIATRGNTSAATVPTALDQGIRDGKIRRGHRLLIPVFGAGVTAGAAAVVY